MPYHQGDYASLSTKNFTLHYFEIVTVLSGWAVVRVRVRIRIRVSARVRVRVRVRIFCSQQCLILMLDLTLIPTLFLRYVTISAQPAEVIESTTTS